jgi:hypothetical protein
MIFDVTWAIYIMQKVITAKDMQAMAVLTIAKGNWSNINSEIAGKIISEVRGRDEATAAVANEAKATRRGIPVQSVILPAYILSIAFSNDI